MYNTKFDDYFTTSPKLVQFPVICGSGKYKKSKVVTIEYKEKDKNNNTLRIIYVNRYKDLK